MKQAFLERAQKALEETDEELRGVHAELFRLKTKLSTLQFRKSKLETQIENSASLLEIVITSGPSKPFARDHILVQIVDETESGIRVKGEDCEKYFSTSDIRWSRIGDPTPFHPQERVGPQGCIGVAGIGGLQGWIGVAGINGVSSVEPHWLLKPDHSIQRVQ